MKTVLKKLTVLAIGLQVGGSISAQAVLDINQIRTELLPRNSLFLNPQQQSASYEVPQGSGKHSMYSSNLWFIGQNTSNQTLHGFAEFYVTNGQETSTGPLKTDGTASTDMATVMEFGRVWKLNRTDIDALILAQGNGSLASGAYVPPVDIVEWPGNGPQNYALELAPFYDANSDNQYNILDGDYPIMKGEQMLYWILNDNFGPHLESGLSAMGVEIHISFYACKNNDATGNDDIINYTTFLEYEIINRSTITYENVYAGFNTDADIGFAQDDFLGSHVDADAFYFYNGDAIDGQGQTQAPDHYGANWPVQSIQFLEGASALNNRQMAGFMYYSNGAGATGAPVIGNGTQFYNLLQSKFVEGSQLHFGGIGFPGSSGATNTQAAYMFPGVSDPTHQGTGGVDPGFIWTQQYLCPSCPEGAVTDVRGVGSSGPYDLAPGGSVKVVLGLISTFDSTLAIPERVEKNRAQNKVLKQWYDANALPCLFSQLSDEQIDGQISLVLQPNPANDMLYISGEKLLAQTKYEVLDINGRLIQSLSSQQDGQMSLNVSGLNTGIYFVRITLKNGQNHTLKFIKSE